MGLLDSFFESSQTHGRLSSVLGVAAAALLAHRSGASGSGGGLLAGLLGGNGVSPQAGAAAPQGVEALIAQFEQNGLGGVVRSWVNNGANQPVTPDQVHQALGRENVDALSQQTGTPREDLLNELAQALPKFIDRLTPNGRVPDQGELTTEPQTDRVSI